MILAELVEVRQAFSECESLLYTLEHKLVKEEDPLRERVTEIVNTLGPTHKALYGLLKEQVKEQAVREW